MEGADNEHCRIVRGAARPYARCHGRLCRAWRGARPGHAGQQAGRGACRCDRDAGVRRPHLDAARHHLPHLLDDQADHRCCDNDPGGGMQAAAGRAGGSVAPRTGRAPGVEATRRAAGRHGAREATDYGARPAHFPHGLRADDGAAYYLSPGEGGVSDPAGSERAADWHGAAESVELGVLLARASGQELETFLRERIFEPLEMRDTGFSVPAASLDRLATSYWTDPQSGELVVYDDAQGGQWSREPAFPSGAGGLVSTIDDYLAFGQMMLSLGKHGNERILSRLSVELMTTDQLTPEQKAVSGLVPGSFDSHGWGFGVSVVTRRDDIAAVPGRYGWDGGLGTSWYSDPREDMVIILMTQCAWTSPSPPNVYFWTLAYQAIDD